MRPPAPDSDAAHFDVYQNYEIEAERRDGLREFLLARGIGTLLPWGGKRSPPMDQALGLRARLPGTEKLFERVLLLPMHPWLTDDDVAAVARPRCEQVYRGRAMKNSTGWLHQPLGRR